MKTNCQIEFEKWFGFEVNENMDIQTECAWDNWRAAWDAARLSLTHIEKDKAYLKKCDLWITSGTKEREKLAFYDGHYRGWQDAADHIAAPGK